MKRLFLLICIALVAGGFLVYQVQQGSGYVLVVIGNTSIEMSLWFGLFACLLFSIFLWVVFIVLRGFYRGFSSTKQRISGYSAHKAQQKTTLGLIEFIEGNWSGAYKKLTLSAKHSSSPIINYLAAARCAYEMGDEQQTLQLLHSAQESTQNSHLAVALTQAKMQLSNKQHEHALAILTRVAKTNPNHNVVLQLQQRVFIALKDWASLRKLLPRLHHQKIGSLESRYHLEEKLYKELLLEKINSGADSNEEKLASIEQIWASIPAHFQKNIDIVTAYIDALMDFKQTEKVAKVIERVLQQQWHEPWVILYGLLPFADASHGLKHAERWYKKEEQQKSAALLLTLARLCLRNQQWGRAKDFLKDSIALQANADAYTELARLYHFLGEEENSQNLYKEGLLASTKELAAVAELSSGEKLKI